MKCFVIHVFAPKIGVIQHITWAIGKDHAQDRIARAHPDRDIRVLSVRPSDHTSEPVGRN